MNLLKKAALYFARASCEMLKAAGKMHQFKIGVVLALIISDCTNAYFRALKSSLSAMLSRPRLSAIILS